ncbi:hypothetical protein BD560DRAFT_413885 [Blakeslea trispora]|nr:hypothetical protein BD560DRAFT_413885 [Blakeslea trispora]
MFDEDEEELELLRQYEGKALDADDDEKYSSDQMDSDLEDKIMSMVQYGSGITKKRALPTNSEPATEPTDGSTGVRTPVTSKDDKKSLQYSDEEYQLEDSDNDSADLYKTANNTEDDSGDSSDNEKESESKEETKATVNQPTVTHYINLDDKHYMEDDETSEEEAELGMKLQKLIDDQIYTRQSKKRFQTLKPVRVCFVCNQPGHERKDCNRCMECGLPRHKESRCTGARYCTRCKRRGHNSADCINEKISENCRICNVHYHHRTVCPSLLHTYVDEVSPRKIPEAWCYYCTSKGHYGDECPHLPNYLSTIPSAFSKHSVGLGNRFEPRKAMKNSAASFGRQHERWSNPSSRESSPHSNAKKPPKKRARNNFNSSDTDDSRYDRDSSKSHKKNKKNKSRGNLNEFFDRGNSSKNDGHRSGNSNWKAINNNSLPQPTRSGTVHMNNSKQRSRQNQDNDGYNSNFPRGNMSDLPKPSSSGVIDLASDNRPNSHKRSHNNNHYKSNNNNNNSNNNNGGGQYSRRGPKYHGGYRQNR